MKVILPKFTNDQIIETINQDDVFYIPDHFPIPGIPIDIESVISDNKTFLDKCILENPNKLFFFSANPQFISDDVQNVVFLPLYFMMQMFLYVQHGNWITPTQNPRQYTACMIGGKERWHRTLASFWLANNIDVKNFPYTMKENNQLSKVNHLIKQSKYKPMNLNPKKCLAPKYIYDQELPLRFSPSVNWSYNDAYFTHKHLYKTITGNAYINIITESHSVELHGSLTENTLRSFVSGNIPLWLGTYKHHKLFRSMDFDVLGDVVDHNHLATTDRCKMVLEGLEKNKFLLHQKDACHELYLQFHGRIEHNFHTALNLRGHILRFHKQIKDFMIEFNKSNLSYQQVDLDPNFIKFLQEEFS